MGARARDFACACFTRVDDPKRRDGAQEPGQHDELRLGTRVGVAAQSGCVELHCMGEAIVLVDQRVEEMKLAGAVEQPPARQDIRRSGRHGLAQGAELRVARGRHLVVQ